MYGTSVTRTRAPLYILCTCMYSQSRLLKKPHEQNLRRAMISADSALCEKENRGLWQRHGYEAKDMGAQETELHSIAQPDSLSELQ